MLSGTGRLFRFLSLAVSLVVGLVVLTVLQIPAAHATSTTFSYTGAEQQYTVPARIDAVTIIAVGARGSSYFGGGPGGPAGLGASVTATVPVTPGETLYLEVGGTGDINDFNGGGTGAAAGGGASDVRTCSMNTCSLASDDTRLVVAGGGGASGGTFGQAEDWAGGNAGDTSAVGAGNGACNYTCSQPAGNGGLGGTAGGLAGGAFATGGSLGQGGNGAATGNAAGGGGGGYFGGGGGNLGGGGGGGSSYWIPSASNTSMATTAFGTPASISVTTVPNITVGTTIPDATYNTSYSTNLLGNGGQAPYTFALSSGSLPGLSLATDGTLSGTPNTVGPFFFTVTVTDANGYKGIQNEEIIVDQHPQSISFTTTPPSHAVVGGPTYTVGASGGSSGGYIVFSYIYFTGPPVCTVNGSLVTFVTPGTCIIGANQAGGLNYSAAPQVEQTFTVYTAPPGPLPQNINFTSNPPSHAMVGGTYSVSATASSSLPVALTIDPSATSACSMAGSLVSLTGPGTCVIDANQVGNGSYLSAPQVQQSFSVQPLPSAGLTITTSSLPDAIQRVRYSTALTAASGNPPYKWSLASGALPRGLHLRANGSITGRLSRSDRGTYTFTVKIVDKRVKVKHRPPTQNSAAKLLSITAS